MSKATDRTRTFKPVAFKFLERRVRASKFDDDVFKAYKGETKGLCEYLRRSACRYLKNIGRQSPPSLHGA